MNNQLRRFLPLLLSLVASLVTPLNAVAASKIVADKAALEGLHN